MQIKRRLSNHDDADNDLDDYRCRYLEGRHMRHKRSRLSPSAAIASNPPKRDIISSLPPELLIRILSYLNETTLLEISPVSRLFHRVTADHQLWRQHYWRRFILPRAHLIPGFKKSGKSTKDATFGGSRNSIVASARPARFSTEATEHPGDYVDWKKSYKLLHNWARGRCDVDEVQLRPREKISLGNTLVKVVEGLAVTADETSGLLIWDLRTRSLLVQTSLDLDAPYQEVRPTCIAVDDELLSFGEIGITLGFEDGSFGVWRMDLIKRQLTKICHHDRVPFGELMAVAYCRPYLLAASRTGSIYLWFVDRPSPSETQKGGDAEAPMPYLLRSLKSYSTRPPINLSIRRVASSVVASIAYTLDTVNGWCIGIQDLDIRPSRHGLPEIIQSRVAQTLPNDAHGSLPSSPESSPGRSSPRNDVHPNGPIGLCYSHPYLLATLPDNTLILHLCTTTPTTLTITPGIRLWGHTSGISDAEITTRGKAVSVSARGDEIRVWELEGRVSGSSVEVRPRECGGAEEPGLSQDVMKYRKNKVDFDDEMVIVLKETVDGRESLMVYDFT